MASAYFLLHACLVLGLFIDPEYEATYSPKTSVDVQRTVRRYVPVRKTLHNHRYQNLNSYEMEVMCSPETLISTLKRTQCRNPEHNRQNSNLCGNLSSCLLSVVID